MGLFGSRVKGIKNILTDSNLTMRVLSDTMCACLEFKENRAFSRWSIENSLHLTQLTSKIFPIPSKPYFVANHDCAIHLTSLPSAALPFVLTLNACIITEVFLSSNKLLTSNAHLSCLKTKRCDLVFSFDALRISFRLILCLCLEISCLTKNNMKHLRKRRFFCFVLCLFFGVYHL